MSNFHHLRIICNSFQETASPSNWQIYLKACVQYSKKSIILLKCNNRLISWTKSVMWDIFATQIWARKANQTTMQDRDLHWNGGEENLTPTSQKKRVWFEYTLYEKIINCLQWEINPNLWVLQFFLQWELSQLFP